MRKILNEEQKIERKLNIKLKLLSIFFNILVFTGIILCAIIYNKYIECIILFIGFVTLRYTYPTTYHSQSFWLCLVYSISIFLIALPNVIPIQYSILFGIIVGLIIDYILYKIQTLIDLQKFYNKYHKVSLETINEEQLVYLCNILHYNKDKIKIAKMFFIQKFTNKQVWEILCNTQQNVEWDTVTKTKYRMKKDFTKILKE